MPQEENKVNENQVEILEKNMKEKKSFENTENLKEDNIISSIEHEMEIFNLEKEQKELLLETKKEEVLSSILQVIFAKNENDTKKEKNESQNSKNAKKKKQKRKKKKK